MNPLLFADWGYINRTFCFLMWMLVFALVMAILVGSAPTETAHHAQHVMVGR